MCQAWSILSSRPTPSPTIWFVGTLYFHTYVKLRQGIKPIFFWSRIRWRRKVWKSLKPWDWMKSIICASKGIVESLIVDRYKNEIIGLHSRICIAVYYSTVSHYIIVNKILTIPLDSPLMKNKMDSLLILNRDWSPICKGLQDFRNLDIYFLSSFFHPSCFHDFKVLTFWAK